MIVDSFVNWKYYTAENVIYIKFAKKLDFQILCVNYDTLCVNNINYVWDVIYIDNE